MIDYKLKVVHDEYDTLNFSSVRPNGKAYTSKGKKWVMIPVCFFQITGICVTP